MKYEMRGKKYEVYRKLIESAVLQEVDIAITFEVPRIDTKSGEVYGFPMIIHTEYTDGEIRIVTSAREGELLSPMQLMKLDIESAVFNVTREGFEKYDVDLGIMLAYDRFHKAVYGFNASIDAKNGMLESVNSECMKYTGMNLTDLITKNLSTPSDAPRGASGKSPHTTVVDEFFGTPSPVNSGDETTSDHRDRGEADGTAEDEDEDFYGDDSEDFSDIDDDFVGTGGVVVNPPTVEDLAEPLVYESEFTTLGKLLGYGDHEVRDEDMNVIGIQYEEAYYRLWLLHNNTRTLFSKSHELVLSLKHVTVEVAWKLYEEFKEANPEFVFVHDVI